METPVTGELLPILTVIADKLFHEPAKTMAEAEVDVLFVTVKVALLAAFVSDRPPAEVMMSPRVMVKEVVPAVPASTRLFPVIAPNLDIVQVPEVPAMSEPVPALVI